ncbi:MAG: hypothetical protein ACI4RA_02050, partial [Kiritimatiellia bacterium]
APDFRRGEVQATRATAKVERPARGFSFLRDVQPILERRCVRCHAPAANAKIPDLTATPVEDGPSRRRWVKSYISLTHGRQKDQARRCGSWFGNPDHPMVNWIHSASVPTPIPPLWRGSRTSRLFTEKLDQGHAPGLTEAELRALACWVDLGVPFCGDYEEANIWTEEERGRWRACVEKRCRHATPGE